MASFDPSKPTKVGSVIKGAVLLAVAAGLVYWQMSGPSSEERSAARISDRLADSAEAARLKEARRVRDAIRMGLRDPASLVFDKMLISADANTACAVYRARNGFGGMNAEALIIVNDKPIVQPKKADLLRHCANGLTDYASALN